MCSNTLVELNSNAQTVKRAQYEAFEFVLKEIGHTTHLLVWLAVRECEADDDVEVVNSTSVIRAVMELTGEYRNRESVLNSMNRVLERTEIEQWPNGYDWRTTERGRAIAEEWGRAPRDRRNL